MKNKILRWILRMYAIEFITLMIDDLNSNMTKINFASDKDLRERGIGEEEYNRMYELEEGLEYWRGVLLSRRRRRRKAK